MENKQLSSAQRQHLIAGLLSTVVMVVLMVLAASLIGWVVGANPFTIIGVLATFYAFLYGANYSYQEALKK